MSEETAMSPGRLAEHVEDVQILRVKQSLAPTMCF